MKTCKICGQTKPESEFYIYNKKTGRMAPYCKPCEKARCNANYHKRESMLKGDQVWINNVIKGPLRREKNDRPQD